jgi:hypothetical protein
MSVNNFKSVPTVISQNDLNQILSLKNDLAEKAKSSSQFITNSIGLLNNQKFLDPSLDEIKRQFLENVNSDSKKECNAILLNNAELTDEKDVVIDTLSKANDMAFKTDLESNLLSLVPLKNVNIMREFIGNSNGQESMMSSLTLEYMMGLRDSKTGMFDPAKVKIAQRLEVVQSLLIQKLIQLSKDNSLSLTNLKGEGYRNLLYHSQMLSRLDNLIHDESCRLNICENFYKNDLPTFIDNKIANFYQTANIDAKIANALQMYNDNEILAIKNDVGEFIKDYELLKSNWKKEVLTLKKNVDKDCNDKIADIELKLSNEIAKVKDLKDKDLKALYDEKFQDAENCAANIAELSKNLKDVKKLTETNKENSDANFRNLSNQVSSFESERSQTLKKIKEFNELINSYDFNSLSSLKQKVDSFSNSLKNYKKELDKNQEREERINKVEHEVIEKTNNFVDIYNEKIKKDSELIKQVENKVSILQDTINVNANKFSKLSEDLENKYTLCVKSDEAIIASLKKDKKSLSESIDQINDDNAKFQEKMNTQLSAWTNKFKKVDEIRDSSNKLLNDVKLQEETLESLKNEIKDLKSTVKNLTNDLNNVKKNYAGINNSLDEQKWNDLEKVMKDSIKSQFLDLFEEMQKSSETQKSFNSGFIGQNNNYFRCCTEFKKSVENIIKFSNIIPLKIKNVLDGSFKNIFPDLENLKTSHKSLNVKLSSLEKNVNNNCVLCASMNSFIIEQKNLNNSINNKLEMKDFKKDYKVDIGKIKDDLIKCQNNITILNEKLQSSDKLMIERLEHFNDQVSTIEEKLKIDSTSHLDSKINNKLKFMRNLEEISENSSVHSEAYISKFKDKRFKNFKNESNNIIFSKKKAISSGGNSKVNLKINLLNKKANPIYEDINTDFDFKKKVEEDLDNLNERMKELDKLKDRVSKNEGSIKNIISKQKVLEKEVKRFSEVNIDNLFQKNVANLEVLINKLRNDFIKSNTVLNQLVNQTNSKKVAFNISNNEKKDVLKNKVDNLAEDNVIDKNIHNKNKSILKNENKEIVQKYKNYDEIDKDDNAEDFNEKDYLDDDYDGEESEEKEEDVYQDNNNQDEKEEYEEDYQNNNNQNNNDHLKNDEKVEKYYPPNKFYYTFKNGKEGVFTFNDRHLNLESYVWNNLSNKQRQQFTIKKNKYIQTRVNEIKVNENYDKMVKKNLIDSLYLYKKKRISDNRSFKNNNNARLNNYRNYRSKNRSNNKYNVNFKYNNNNFNNSNRRNKSYRSKNRRYRNKNQNFQYQRGSKKRRNWSSQNKRQNQNMSRLLNQNQELINQLKSRQIPNQQMGAMAFPMFMNPYQRF